MKLVAFMRMVLLLYHPAERLRQYHVVQHVGLGEQRGYLRVPEACYAAAYAGDVEGQLLVLPCKLRELVHVGLHGLHAALHGGDGVTLSLQPDALAHDGAEACGGHPGGSAHVYSFQIAAKYEHFAFP